MYVYIYIYIEIWFCFAICLRETFAVKYQLFCWKQLTCVKMHAKYYHLTRSPRGEHKPTWPTRSWRAKAHLAYAPQKRHKSANGPSWRASAHLPTSSKQSSRRKPHMQMTFFVIKCKEFFGPFFGFSFNE